MPFIHIQMMDDGKDEVLRAELIARVTDTVHEVLGLPREHVWIVLQDVPMESWGVGGRSIAAMRNVPPA